MKPLDVLEWLQGLALTDDFAREALEIVENDCTEAYLEIRADLEKEAGKTFDEDFRLVGHFVDRSQLLDELADTLDQAGFKGDVDDALQAALGELEELREAAKPKLEWDL